MSLEHRKLRQELYSRGVHPSEINKILSKHEASMSEDEVNALDDETRNGIFMRKSLAIVQAAQNIYRECNKHKLDLVSMGELKESLDALGFGHGLDENI